MKTTTQDYLAQDFIIEVKFIAPTNSRGARIKIHSPYLNKSFFIPFNYEHNSGLDHLAELLIKKNIPVISRASLPKCDYVLINWESGKELFNI